MPALSIARLRRKAWPWVLWTVLALGLLFVSARLYRHGRHHTHACEATYFPQGQAAFVSGRFDAAIEAFQKSIQTAPNDPHPYRQLIEAYARKGDPNGAEPFLRSRSAAEPRNACVHFALGKLVLARHDLDAALAEARQAVALDPHLGYAHLLLGLVHYSGGRPQEAVQAWRVARKMFREDGDRLGEALTLGNMVGLDLDRNDLQRALIECRQTLALYRSLGDPDDVRTALRGMGLVQVRMGEFRDALATLHAALALSRERHDRDGEWRVMEYLCTVHRKTGDYRRALGYADSIVAVARGTGDPLGEMVGLLHRAMACNDLGDPLESLQSCRRAQTIADSLKDTRNRASVLLTLADADLRLGRLSRARESYALCDSLAREVGRGSTAAMAVAGLCKVALQERDTTQALTLGTRALEMSRELAYVEGEAFVARLVSDLALKRGDSKQALALSNRAVDLNRQSGSRLEEALALAKRALVRLTMGDSAGAEMDADDGRSIALRIRSPEALWFCEMAVGDVERRRDPEGACERYRAAMDAVESIHRRLRLEEFKAGYLESRIELYFKAADLLVELGRPAEALDVCERSRARAFRDLLASSPTPVSPRVPEPLAVRSRAIEERLRILQATLAGVAAAPGSEPARVRALERELATTKSEWEEIRTDLLLQDPRYGAALAGALPVDADRILHALAADEAVLEYFLGARRSLCLVACRGEIHAVRLEATATGIAEEVGALCGPLLSPHSLGALSFDVGLARRLREQIFDPVVPFLEGVRRLWVVPDGPMNCLPFDALVVSSQPSSASDTLFASFGQMAFVGDRYAIAYLPSASLLVLGSRHAPEGAAPSSHGSLLAFGNPIVGSALGPDRGNEGESGSAWHGEQATASAGLGFSDQEVHQIARLFPDAVCEVGRRATEQSFKRLSPGFRLVHVATHGTVDEAVPLYSGLALAADSTSVEDGFLHAYEVLSVPLDCDLVTLSACETGLGRLYAGEGLLGLTRSFLYAGARQVLVSLWSVNDASTAKLMESFYGNLAKGMEAIEALQEAKRSLRRTTVAGAGGRPMAYAHPFFWAPFVLVGSPRTP